MRGRWMMILLMAFASSSLSATRAGLYTTTGLPEGPYLEDGIIKPLAFKPFQELLSRYFAEVVSPQTAVHKEFQHRRQAFAARAKSNSLSLEEQIDYSACLLRLRAYDEAIQLLTPLAIRERGNFMVLANLACAYQLAGRLERALEYLQQVRDVWPPEWPGLPKEQYDWLKEAESYHLKLVRLRYRESMRRLPGKHPDSLDQLFGDEKSPLRFVGESGNYEAGKLAASERAKLPKNALAIVQQLLIWFPDDTRLYWLLGELYNAQGDMVAAAAVFENCVWSRRYDAPDLREHRKLVQEAKPANESVQLEDEPKVTASARPEFLPGKEKLWIVGSVAGLFIAVLAYFQIREIRRRRRTL